MAEVFFIGDVALDEYYQTDYFPRLKEKVIMHAMPAQMGGSIANAACVFSAAGNHPHFLTALNSSPVSHKLIDGLNAAGIDTTDMVCDDSLPDAKCIIILAENEHTVFISTLGIETIQIDEGTYRRLCEGDYIYSNLCEISPLCYDGKKGAELLNAIRANGTKLWCDLDCANASPKEMELLKCMDAVFLNEAGEEKMEQLLGADWKKQMFDMGLSLLVVTKAECGCEVYRPGEDVLRIGGISVPVSDVTGAGDTFGSSFLHAWLRCGNISLSAEYANYAAARSVTGIGARCGAVPAEEVLRFIAEHGGDPERFRCIL